MFPGLSLHNDAYIVELVCQVDNLTALGRQIRLWKYEISETL